MLQFLCKFGYERWCEMRIKLINADKFAEAICKFPAIDENAANAVIFLLQKQPNADVVEVKHGEWLDNIKVISTVGMANIKAFVGYRCSVCGREEVAKEPYCNCGAKMDGGKAE